jgi:hypothetical protein
LLCAGRRQFADWSADYRLFSQDQWDGQQLFAPVRRGVLELSDTVCVKAVSCCIENQPISTQKLIQQLRSEVWSYALEQIKADSNDFGAVVDLRPLQDKVIGNIISRQHPRLFDDI